jgi:hypothetical protein
LNGYAGRRVASRIAVATSSSRGSVKSFIATGWWPWSGPMSLCRHGARPVHERAGRCVPWPHAAGRSHLRCTCSKYSYLSGPYSARQSRIRRCSVRRCDGPNRPGCAPSSTVSGRPIVGQSFPA